MAVGETSAWRKGAAEFLSNIVIRTIIGRAKLAPYR